eukprot:scaffold13842_cov115-Isochrysis_galbana.AAC.12
MVGAASALRQQRGGTQRAILGSRGVCAGAAAYPGRTSLRFPDKGQSNYALRGMGQPSAIQQPLLRKLPLSRSQRRVAWRQAAGQCE